MDSLIRLIGSTLLRSAIYRGTRGASAIVLIVLGLVGAVLYTAVGR